MEKATQTVNWTTDGGDYDPTVIGSMTTTSQGWQSTNLPVALVESWMTTPATNNGMILIASGGDESIIEITSREGDVSQIPYIELSLSPPCLLAIDLDSTDVICAGDSNGTVDLKHSGGVNPLTFLWSNGADTEDLTNLNGGIYEVTVTDDNNCSVVSSIIINEPDTLEVNLSSLSPTTCPGDNVATVTANTNGGISPYDFQWSDGQTLATAINLGEGWQFVTVTDVNLCTIVDSIFIRRDSLSYDITPESCPGAGDGSIISTIQEGPLLGISRLWSTGATTPYIDNLSIGTYYVTITDNRGCSFIDTVDVNQTLSNIELSESITNVTTFGGNDGAIDISVINGTAPFDYNWSTGDTTQDISTLTAGDYYLTVTGDNGCSLVDTFSVIELIASGNLRKRASQDSVLTGVNFTYEIQYSCSGTVSGCENVTVIDTLPPEVEFIAFGGNTAHSSNTYYDSGSHRVVFELNNETGTGLNSGSTGSVSITVRFPNGTTPDSTIAQNQAWFISDNLAPGASGLVETRAIAHDKWVLDKTLETSVPFTDRTYTYTIEFSDTASVSLGTENISGIYIIDTLPIGASYIGASSGGVYNGAENTVTWNLGDRNVADLGTISTMTVDLVFPSSNFAVGDIIINTAVAFGTPINDVEQVIGLDTTQNEIQNPSISSNINKRTNGSNYIIGDEVNWKILAENTSDVPVDNFVLIDSIPTEVALNAFETGGYVGDGSISYTISYQTNLNSTWQTWPGSPFGASNQVLNVSAVSLGVGEYISILRWDYGTVPYGFTNDWGAGGNNIDLWADIIDPGQNGNTVSAGDLIENCAGITWDYNSTSYDGQNCTSLTIQSFNPEGRIEKSVDDVNDFYIGNTVTYNFDFRNSGDVDLDTFRFTDTIPEEIGLTSIQTGVFDGNPYTQEIYYQTNLNSNWQVWPGSPFDGSTNSTLLVSALGLAAGEYISIVQYDFGTVPVNFNLTSGMSWTGEVLSTDYYGNTVNVGDTVSNCAYVDFEYEGNPRQRFDCIDVILEDIALPSIFVDKWDQNTDIDNCENFHFGLNMSNPSDFELDSLRVIDTIPSNMVFTSLNTGTWTNNQDLKIWFQTTEQGSWILWPGFPIATGTQSYHEITELSLNRGERVTMVMWDFETVPPRFGNTGNDARISGYFISPGLDNTVLVDGDFLENCVSISAVHSDSTLTMRDCADMRVDNVDGSGVEIDKSHNNGFSLTRVGESFNYILVPAYYGTAGLDSFVMIDTIPVQMEFTATESGGWQLPFGNDVIVRYQTNLNNVWTDWPTGPFAPSSDTQLPVGDLGLGTGEYVTILMWDFGLIPPCFRNNGNRPRVYGNLLAVDREGNPVEPYDKVENCAYLIGEENGTLITAFDCDEIEVEPPIIEADPYKEIKRKGTSNSYSTYDEFYYPGDTITYRIRIESDYSSEVGYPDPIALDLLPADFSYVSGSWAFTSNPNSAPDPIFENILNYNGSGRELLRWSWEDGSSWTIPQNSNMRISFQVVVGASVTAEQIIDNRFYQTTNAVDFDRCDEGDDIDIFDLDGDGDLLETICHDNSDASIKIGTSVSLESEKLVLGQLDSVFSKFPDYASTVPGGIADYQLVVKNTGTVPMKDIVVIDILPFVGDSGVINLVPRYSRWRPSLVSAVEAPSGITVFYSTSENPCRDTEGFVASGPVGCSTPNWNTTPPTDMSTVQSLKFDFGSVVLQPGDELSLDWSMRAPVNVLDGIGVIPDSIAWNSFAFLATRADNDEVLLPGEPLKVGVKIETQVPGVYGDWVWSDTNGNGVQNNGELGIDGVRVELYKDNGDGIPDLATDSLTSFTLTSSGGYYLFPRLKEGDYFTVFYPSPSYDLSPINAIGDKELDSDGRDTTINGFPAAITAISHLTEVQYDLSWDLGLTATTSNTVGNYVWHDINGDGLQDESLSEGLNGIQVLIYDNSNPTSPVDSTVTGDDPSGNPGFYLFTNVSSGDYFIEFKNLPTLAIFTTQGPTTGPDAADSDVNISSGLTEVFTVNSGNYDDSWDAGIILPTGVLSLGDFIWNDLNNDGDFDPGDGEEGINNVDVNLYVDTDGNNQFTPGVDQLFNSTKTFTSGGNPGFYLFQNLPELDYIVQIDPSNFNTGSVLENFGSSLGTALANDPDDNVDSEDNGMPLSGYGVVSFAISLTNNAEPTLEDGDNNTNLTLDFGLADCTDPIVFSGTPADTLVDCHGVPDPPIIGVELTAVSNCYNISVTYEADTIGVSCDDGFTIVRKWIATDEIGQQDSVSQEITVQDTIAPVLSGIPADVTLDCDLVDPAVTPSINDNCDTEVDLVFSEVLVYKTSDAGCQIWYTISNILCDDNGTPIDITDDIFSFDLSVIGQNTGANWNTTINGVPISANYNTTQRLGPFPRNLSGIDFILIDSDDASCSEIFNVTPVCW